MRILFLATYPEAILRVLFFGLLMFNHISCTKFQVDKDQNIITEDTSSIFMDNLTELKRCDILVKPNHNWLPGTSYIPGGSGFGHAIIVTEDCSASNTDTLLKIASIFVSHSRDVPPAYQIRSGKAWVPDTDLLVSNMTFGNINAGYRYRLRMDLNETQKDSILASIIRYDNGTSSWRAIKRTQPDDSLDNEKQYYYCSLLIWQAFHHVLGIDLDVNNGQVIYPNDLINSPFFDNVCGKINRVRF